MTIGRTERLAGILIAEDRDRLPWNAWQYDKLTHVCVTGELETVRWELTRHAYRLAMEMDLDRTLQAFADRVGVEYSRHSNAATDSNEHNGGNPWQ